MKRFGILLLTLVLGVTLSFAQGKKPTDRKSDTAKSATTDKKSGGAFDKGAEAPAGKIDVNSASQQELEKLSGIGPVTAKKIVDGRPYKTKRDLLTKKVVSQSEYDKIKDNIIAHQDASTAPASAKAETNSSSKKK